MANDLERRVEQLERRVSQLEALLLRQAGADANGRLPVLDITDIEQVRQQAALKAYGYKTSGRTVGGDTGVDR